MSDKKLYLLNFSGPNFLARFAALFHDLKKRSIETVDFQYQANFGFGAGLLCLECSSEMQDDVFKYAESLDWNRSFVSSNLPKFYLAQNEEYQTDVRFMLLDDQYMDVLNRLKNSYEAKLQEGEEDATYTLEFQTGQKWLFVCAPNLMEARRRLLAPETCDILLLDMKLDTNAATEHEGVEFFNDLRAADRLLPTIVITQGPPPRADGTAHEWGQDIVQEYWQAGAWNFLPKRDLYPRLAQIIDLIVDRRSEPLVIIVTTDSLSEDLANIFGFLRNEPVKVVRASCVPDFKNRVAGRDHRGKVRLVIECAKHETISTTDLQDKFKDYIAQAETNIHRNLSPLASDWVRFHHGGIYEAMRLS